MSESDTVFNKRDWRCAAVQLMLSTDPNYDCRTIASTLKMHRWIAMNNRDMLRVMKTKFLAMVMVFGVVSSEGRIMPPHIFESRLKSQHQCVPGCTEECSDPLVPSGGRWQTLGVAAGLGTGPQVQRDPGLASEVVLQLCTLISQAPLLPQPEPTGLLRLVICWEHHQHDLPQHQSQPDHRYPPSIHRTPTDAYGKACSLFRIHIEAVIEAEGGYIELCSQLYYIIKLAELIFVNKSFKIKL